jgi:hypothetical protein
VCPFCLERRSKREMKNNQKMNDSVRETATGRCRCRSKTTTGVALEYIGGKGYKRYILLELWHVWEA